MGSKSFWYPESANCLINTEDIDAAFHESILNHSCQQPFPLNPDGNPKWIPIKSSSMPIKSHKITITLLKFNMEAEN